MRPLKGLSCIYIATLVLAMSVTSSAQNSKKAVPIKSTEGGEVVRGDDEIHTDDYTKVDVRYELSIDQSRKNIIVVVVLDAFECNDDKTYGDTHLRLTLRRTVFTAPEGRTIARIADSALTGSHGEFLRGKRHGPQTFQRKRVGSLTRMSFTIDGKGRKDHNRMNFHGTIEFTPVLR